MATFTILHVSDAHIGHPSYELDTRLALDPLLDDVRELGTSQGLVADLVIFSGDLAYGQLPGASIQDQYEVARTFLENLTNSFSIPLFIVPGNHDVNRTRIEPAQQEWLSANISADEKIERDVRDHSSTWTGILQRQQDWVEFVKSLSLNCNYVLDPHTFLGSGTLTTQIGPVNLIGLNTAWASSAADRRGALRVGPHQYKQVRSMRRSMKGWVICVGHHPPTWLHNPEGADLKKFLEVESDLFLHGHEHDVWFEDLPDHLRIAAGACYQGSNKTNVYQWIRLDDAAKRTQLFLRTLNTRGGSDAWVPYTIPKKTDAHGIATIRSPFVIPAVESAMQESTARTANDIAESAADGSARSVQPTITAATASPTEFSSLDLESFIHFIDEHLHFRWESHTFKLGNGPVSVFWPVRLRSPTAIHAVQAFAAAGLARQGANVTLSLDDFGNVEYSGDAFVNTVRNWWERVGADPSLLQIEYFREVLSSERYQELWRNIQRLFGESDFDLQRVLRLAKYLPARADSEVDFKEFATKRPRKLLTPTLVWTALLWHWETRRGHRIITLGGSDEQELWKTWWDVVSPARGGHIGHLFNPELLRPRSGEEVPLHMEASPDFRWQARADVVRWFEMDLKVGGEWTDPSRMLPWCLNGCVRLPAFISDVEQEWHLGDHMIATDRDLTRIKTTDEIRAASHSLATIVTRMIL